MNLLGEHNDSNVNNYVYMSLVPKFYCFSVLWKLIMSWLVVIVLLWTLFCEQSLSPAITLSNYVTLFVL